MSRINKSEFLKALEDELKQLGYRLDDARKDRDRVADEDPAFAERLRIEILKTQEARTAIKKAIAAYKKYRGGR